jgi:hypothetical protein
MKRNVRRSSTCLIWLRHGSGALVSPGTISRLGGGIVLFAVAAVFSVNLLQAQSSAARGLQSGSLTPGNLAAMVATVAQTTPSPPESIPMTATFYSAQNPQWPPFPANCNSLPAWNLGGNVWMLADLDFDYQAQAQAYAMARAMDSGTPPVPGGGGGGSGSGSGGGGGASPSYTTNDIWLEVAAWTNATAWFTVHPPATNAATGVYDLFMTTNLSADVPGLNLTNWVWLLRTDPGQTNLVVLDLPLDQAFFLLGTMSDSDGDGLTDAFELLLSHSDPANKFTRGDGIDDLTAYLQGRNPRVPGSLPDTNGLVNLQVYTPLR